MRVKGFNSFGEVGEGGFILEDTINFIKVGNLIEHIAIFIKLFKNYFSAEFVSFRDGGILGVEGEQFIDLFF